MSLADLSTLARPVAADPDRAWPAYRSLIEFAIDNQPRSLQKRIGPSELGTSCDRCLIHKLAGHEEHRPPGASWLPYIGTAVHASLGEVFVDANRGLDRTRYLSEVTVSVGELGGQDITGHADLVDLDLGIVADFKIVGATTLKKAKAKGPSSTYRAQGHLYARGLHRRGIPVQTVAILFLPRNSPSLSDAYAWTGPYDEAVAVAALDRADQFATWLQMFGADEVLAKAPPHNGVEFSCARWPSDNPNPGGRELAGLLPQAPAAHPGVGSTHAGQVPAAVR